MVYVENYSKDDFQDISFFQSVNLIIDNEIWPLF
jgi:hypothetical protein